MKETVYKVTIRPSDETWVVEVCPESRTVEESGDDQGTKLSPHQSRTSVPALSQKSTALHCCDTEGCTKTFKTAANLKKHLLTHSAGSSLPPALDQPTRARVHNRRGASRTRNIEGAAHAAESQIEKSLTSRKRKSDTRNNTESSRKRPCRKSQRSTVEDKETMKGSETAGNRDKVQVKRDPDENTNAASSPTPFINSIPQTLNMSKSSLNYTEEMTSQWDNADIPKEEANTPKTSNPEDTKFDPSSASVDCRPPVTGEPNQKSSDKQPSRRPLVPILITCCECEAVYPSRLRVGVPSSDGVLGEGVTLACVTCEAETRGSCQRVTQTDDYPRPVLVCPNKGCHGRYSSVMQYCQHKARHDPDPQLCPDCGRVFKNKHQLSGHRESVHRDRSKDKLCETCGKPFKNSNELRRHVKSMHVKKTQFTCEICGKVTKNEYLLNKVHMLKHQKKSFKCSVCGKVFSSQQGHYAHYKAHFLENKCDICHKTFTTISGYRKHIVREHPSQNLEDPAGQILLSIVRENLGGSDVLLPDSQDVSGDSPEDHQTDDPDCSALDTKPLIDDNTAVSDDNTADNHLAVLDDNPAVLDDNTADSNPAVLDHNSAVSDDNPAVSDDQTALSDDDLAVRAESDRLQPNLVPPEDPEVEFGEDAGFPGEQTVEELVLYNCEVCGNIYMGKEQFIEHLATHDLYVHEISTDGTHVTLSVPQGDSRVIYQ